MFLLMLALGIGGGAILFGAPILARLLVGREGDPVGITRVLQVIGIALLVGALFARPHREDTAAFPPPPDSPTVPAQ